MHETSIRDRYVQLLDRRNQAADIPYDRAGFLDLDAVPDAEPAVDLVGATESYVLLAPGGVGKTTVLAGLSKLELGRSIDLATLSPGELRAEMHAARTDGRPRYLDALDEAAHLQPSTLRVLKREYPNRVAWRLSCRPASWDGGFPTSIRRFRLLPLTRDGARSMLSAMGVGIEFLDRLVEAGLGRLSATPLLLAAVAKQWQQDGRLPATRDDALNHMIDLLLKEGNTDHHPAVSADLRRRTAGRLAAMAMFTGTARFALRVTSAPGAVTVDELPSVPEPDRPDTAIGPDHYREVLATALFHAAGDDIVTFQHHEYAEYLAARYVVDRRPVNAQIASLLGTVDGVTPTAVINVAAWIASRRPEYADILLPRNALALAQTEAHLSAAVRSLVVAALLQQARFADLDPHWSLDLGPLVHPELDKQLATHLTTGLSGDFDAWWVSRLALAGTCHSLVPELQAIALDPARQPWARRPAIAAIARLGGAADRARLTPLLALGDSEDPDDELFAAVIDEFYGREVNTTALLGLLRSPRSDLIGAYRKFLWELPDRVPHADLSELAAWAGRHGVNDVWHQERPWRQLARAVQQRIQPPSPESATRPSPRVATEPEADRPASGANLDRINTSLAATRQDVQRWWELCACLVGTDEPTQALFDADLTARSGWAMLDDKVRREIFDLGIEFLGAHVPGTRDWAGRRSAKSNVLLRDNAGVYLLATFAGHAPDRLAGIPRTVLSVWAPTVAVAWCYGHRDLLGRLTDALAPDLQDEIVSSLLGDLDVRNTEETSLDWSPVHGTLADRLMPSVIERLRANHYRPDLAKELLEQVVRWDPDAALPLCRDLVRSEISDAAQVHLARLDPCGTVDRFVEGQPVTEAGIRGIDPDRLDDNRLSRLVSLLFERFPPASDPPPEDGWNSAYEIRSLRNRTIELLSERALIHDLEQLADTDDPNVRYYVRLHLRRARQVAADNSPVHLTPDGLMHLLARSDVRLVRHDRDLLDVLLDQLTSLQHAISREGAFRDLWNGDRPCSEDDISDWVCRGLRQRMSNGGMVDREIQVVRTRPSGVGTRMDLTATTTTATTYRIPARVIVEAKLDTNRGLDHALRTQLVDSYLRSTDRRHGIYLVYWTGTGHRWLDPQTLSDKLNEQATELKPEFDVRVFVLNVSRPQT